MTLVFRHQKNEPLTIEEMDGNFAALNDRLHVLETSPRQAEGIAKISQEGDQLTVLGTSGRTLGMVVLPKAFPAFRGKWQAGTDYRILDWIQEENAVYSCISPHSSEDFLKDRQHWALVFDIVF